MGVEEAFHQRSSFLLVAESMLLAAFAAALSLRSALPWVTVSLAAFGGVLTCLWWYVNARHYSNYRQLREAVEEVCPEYKRVRKMRRKRGPSTWFVVSHLLPALRLVVWVVLLLQAGSS